MITRSRQRGLTMTSFLFVAVLVIFFGLLTMRLAPAYMQHFAVKKILSDMGLNPALRSMSNAQIRDMFEKRAMVDNLNIVSARDIKIERGNEKPVVIAEYVYETPFIGNLSLKVDFTASSSPQLAKDLSP